jgi:putative ABC transport system permease protein
MSVGVAVILTILHLNGLLDSRLSRDLRGIDLVVSGKGSPLQIILANVFHLDVPTGNIPVSEAKKLEKNPLVRSFISLAYGDNYNGHRIVGTTSDYIEHFNGHISQGRNFSAPMEVIIGGAIAKKFHLAIGQKIAGAHGLVNSDDVHTDSPYTIVGILDQDGSILDRLVLTSVESVWHVHEHLDEDDREEVAYKQAHPEDELSAILIAYKSPLAATTLPGIVNNSSSMQAASPAFEVARLTKLMGTGRDILSVFGYLLLAFSGISLFIALYNAVQERQYDIALMRIMGITKSRIFGLVLFETVLIGGQDQLLVLLFPRYLYVWRLTGSIFRKDWLYRRQSQAY